MKRHCYCTTSKPWYSPHLHKIAKAKDRPFHRSRGKPADSRIVLAYNKMRNWVCFWTTACRTAILQKHWTPAEYKAWLKICKELPGGLLWSLQQMVFISTDSSDFWWRWTCPCLREGGPQRNINFTRQCSAPSAEHPPSLPTSSSS